MVVTRRRHRRCPTNCSRCAGCGCLYPAHRPPRCWPPPAPTVEPRRDPAGAAGRGGPRPRRGRPRTCRRTAGLPTERTFASWRDASSCISWPPSRRGHPGMDRPRGKPRHRWPVGYRQDHLVEAWSTPRSPPIPAVNGSITRTVTKITEPTSSSSTTSACCQPARPPPRPIVHPEGRPNCPLALSRD